MSRIPLHTLQTFVTAARTRNLSRAAEVLNLTVSALSHQMRGLEERLACKLFLRGPRGLTLTAQGQQLLETVGPPLDQIDRGLKRMRHKRDDTLTVSVMPRVASGWLVPRLPRFVQAHPEIELNIQSSIDLVDFDRDPVDVALRFGRGEWAGVRSEPLFDEYIQPVASSALLERVGYRAGDDWSKLPLLGAPSDRWNAWFEQFGGTAPPRYVANFDDSETLLKAALEGLGVALGPVTLALPLLECCRLVALSHNRLRSDFSHWLVYPLRSEDHAGMHAFRSWALAEAQAYNAEMLAVAGDACGTDACKPHADDASRAPDEAANATRSGQKAAKVRSSSRSSGASADSA